MAQQCKIKIPPLLDSLLLPNNPTGVYFNILISFNTTALSQKGASFQV